MVPGGGGYGGAGSHATSTTGQPYGDGSLRHLLGGSGGGGFTVDTAGGGGGGALRLKSAGLLRLNSAIRSLGGSGSGGAAGGSGGAVHLIGNSLELSTNSQIDTSGGYNGGVGGRIFLEADTAIANSGFNNLINRGGDGVFREPVVLFAT